MKLEDFTEEDFRSMGNSISKNFWTLELVLRLLNGEDTDDMVIELVLIDIEVAERML